MRKFKKIYIEITNICNLSCHFCPGTSRAPVFMKQELFERIIAEIKNHTGQVYFHVMGEPLLHQHLGLFLDICHQSGVKVNITTNGTLISEKAETLLGKPALRQVNFSLHSCEANSGESKLDEYLDNIFAFIENSRKIEKLLIGLRLWNLSNNTRSDFNKKILERIKVQYGIKGDLKDEVTPVNGFKLSENIFLHIANEFEWPDMKSEEVGERGFCYGLRDQVAILVNGTVVPCCLDREGSINLGNIKAQSFESIINGYNATSIYESFSNRKALAPLCLRCSYRTRFN
jgi:Predicted Fe-S oxidoreductases